ncbi:hypothetical protein AB0G15_29305 [Streptosporangium sp. NPDC023825]|uniref:hypothetical protein n=1 Tax=Streptosporangium sp. NPDC023825 TaxID=3154909 RepID=UPI003413D35F
MIGPRTAGSAGALPGTRGSRGFGRSRFERDEGDGDGEAGWDGGDGGNFEGAGERDGPEDLGSLGVRARVGASGSSGRCDGPEASERPGVRGRNGDSEGAGRFGDAGRPGAVRDPLATPGGSFTVVPSSWTSAIRRP